jgi:antitoxin Phd
MEVLIESLMSYDEFLTNPIIAMEKVEELGKVIIIKNNRPMFILKTFDDLESNDESVNRDLSEQIQNHSRRPYRRSGGNTLREAVLEVFRNSEEDIMHVSDIADILYNEKLYTKRDGSKAHYTQVRAMCGQYPEEFITLPGNRVKVT